MGKMVSRDGMQMYLILASPTIPLISQFKPAKETLARASISAPEGITTLGRYTVEALGVNPDYHRRGIGKRLVEVEHEAVRCF